MALPTTILGGSVANFIGSGLIQAFGQRIAGQYASSATRLQGQAQEFTYDYNAKSVRREGETLQKNVEQQLYANDLATRQSIEDLKFKYAQAGIPTTSGSAANNINSAITQASIQRKLIQEAGSQEQLDIQLAVINLEYQARTTRLASDYAASAQKKGAKTSADLTILGAGISSVAYTLPYLRSE